MIRIHRRSKHRIMATVFRLPIRNYACRNCQWQGVLLFYPPVGEITEAEALPDPIKSDGVQAIQTEADDQDLSTVKPALPSSNNDQGLLEHESLQDQPEARSRDQLSLLTAEPDHDLIHEAKPEGNESPQDNDLILAVEENVSFPSQPAGTVAASAVTSAEDDNLTRGDSRQEIITEKHESLPERSEARLPDQLSSLTAEPDHDQIPEAESEADESSQFNDSISDIQEKEPFLSQPMSAVAASAVTSAEDNNLTQVESPRDPVSECDQEIVGRAIVVTPFDLTLRTTPSNTADIILSLKPDTIVKIIKLADENSPVNWRQICYEGRVGWVSAAFLRHLQE